MRVFVLLLTATYFFFSCTKSQQEPVVDDKGVSGQYRFTIASWGKYFGDTANLQVEGESTLTREFTGKAIYNPVTDKVNFSFDQNFPLKKTSFELPLYRKQEISGDNTFYYTFQEQGGVAPNIYYSNKVAFNVRQTAPFEVYIFVQAENYTITGATMYRESTSGTGQKE